MRKKIRLYLMAVCVLFLLPVYASAGSYTLDWQSAGDSELDHYNVYCGTASRAYGPPVSAGKNTSHTFTDLIAGKTYYFAVTSVNQASVESSFSEEVKVTIAPEPESLQIIEKRFQSADELWSSINALIEKHQKEGQLSQEEMLKLQLLINKYNQLYSTDTLQKTSKVSESRQVNKLE